MALILVPLMLVLVFIVRLLLAAIFAFPLYWGWNASIATSMGAPAMDWGTAFASLVVLSIVASWFAKTGADVKA